uniref:Centromere protein M n=1 Tax=Ciona savignyi TaxID=51511 RepID=H2ZCA0_CIOSA
MYTVKLKRAEVRPDAICSVLLVGELGAELENLAGLVLKNADEQGKHVDVCTTNHLPILGEDANQPFSVSMIAMVVNLNCKNTILKCRESLQQVPLSFFDGRLLLAALNIADEENWSAEPEEIFKISSQYDCPVLWGNLENRESMNILCRQLLQVLHNLSNTNLITTRPTMYIQNPEGRF